MLVKWSFSAESRLQIQTCIDDNYLDLISDEIFRFKLKVGCEFFSRIATTDSMLHILHDSKKKLKFNSKFRSDRVTRNKFQVMTINMSYNVTCII